MLTVCTSSTDVDYASTGDAMQALYGATTTAVVQSTQEIQAVSAQIRRASAWAESVLGYPLGVATYQETVAAYGGRRLILSRTPIRAVLRLFDSTTTNDATEYESSEFLIESRQAGLLARNRGFEWSMSQRVSGGDFSMGLTPYHQPGMEMRPWLVEYVAGYVPLGGIDTGSPNWTTDAAEGTSTGSTLPEDIRDAVAMRVAERFSNPTGVVSRRVGDLAVEYASAGPVGQRRSSSAAEDLLAPYVRL